MHTVESIFQDALTFLKLFVGFQNSRYGKCAYSYIHRTIISEDDFGTKAFVHGLVGISSTDFTLKRLRILRQLNFIKMEK